MSAIKLDPAAVGAAEGPAVRQQALEMGLSLWAWREHSDGQYRDDLSVQTLAKRIASVQRTGRIQREWAR